MTDGAVLLANGMLDNLHAKTSHALIRGPSRYALRAVVDAGFAGRDAGVVLDGRPRQIPVVASVAEALDGNPPPTVCIVGVATAGGVLPPSLRASLLDAARAGLTLVNGLHRPLADDRELAEVAARHGATLVDLRRPRPVSELRFWSGDILQLATPRLAVLGMDCAIGKRTTAVAIRDAARRRGLRAEVVYTGQTGWLQGLTHGFFLDATPNDFVAGELERAILDCQRDTGAQLIVLEGQASLRNPSGPCGSEFLVSAGAKWVVLQHAPAREYHVDAEGLNLPIPPVAEEIALIESFGAKVVAVGLHEAGLDEDSARAWQTRLADELGLPVVRPLVEGGDGVLDRLELSS
jgi:uncharacterized NAD-dependent epimerase/dehydratase family protein